MLTVLITGRNRGSTPVPMAEAADASDKEMLFRELSRIHNVGWIEACRLTSTVEKLQCSNAGGTTLEAELGIVANSSPDPDFRGWGEAVWRRRFCRLFR